VTGRSIGAATEVMVLAIRRALVSGRLASSM